jgi:hypothetical protein
MGGAPRHRMLPVRHVGISHAWKMKRSVRQCNSVFPTASQQLASKRLGSVQSRQPGIACGRKLGCPATSGSATREEHASGCQPIFMGRFLATSLVTGTCERKHPHKLHSHSSKSSGLLRRNGASSRGIGRASDKGVWRLCACHREGRCHCRARDCLEGEREE